VSEATCIVAKERNAYHLSTINSDIKLFGPKSTFSIILEALSGLASVKNK